MPASTSKPVKRQPARKAVRKTPVKKAPAKKVVSTTQAPVKASTRALSAFEERFTKRFGAGTIAKAAKRTYQVVSTGSITLDIALGSGGWIVGRIAEIWGPESVAKTTLALCGIANFQVVFPNKMAAIIDMERSFDAAWAAQHGVDLDRMHVLKPHSSEDVSDMARMLVESGMYSIIVLDSVGGMITEEEMSNDAAKASVGTAAKIITRMVKQCAVFCDDTDTTLIIVNQVRAVISPQGGDTTGGGKALKHVTTHKVRLKRTGDDPFYIGAGENRELVGFVVGATVEKNKVAPPRRVANFALFNQTTREFGPVGIDRAREAFQIAKRLGIIEEVSTGRFLLPGEEKAVHGMPQTLARLRADRQMLDSIRQQMLAKLAEEVHIADEVSIDSVEEGEEQPVIEAVSGGGLDFSSRTADDADYRAIDQLRDNELMEAAATAR